jgi:hypothetical protein
VAAAAWQMGQHHGFGIVQRLELEQAVLRPVT